MELYERQQFDLLLQSAVERYVERIEQRNQGAAHALARLRRDRDGEGVWMSRFIDAFFEDFLLDNAAGAAFVMRALASRPAPELSSESGQAPVRTVEQLMAAVAKAVFAELFFQNVQECLEQHASFQPEPAGTD